MLASAKTGVGVHDILEAIVRDVPAPKGSADAPLRALIFDSWYDSYRGVIVLFRVIDGTIKPGMKIRFFNTGRDYQVETIGVNRPRPTLIDSLSAGEVGFMTASIKTVADVQIGDTITEAARPTTEPFPGFQEIKPMVFAGLYPVEANQYEELRDALDKLRLNDASFIYEPETSVALGFGFRCGFLGLLHMEIVQERLEREFDLDLITTAPGVRYRVTTTDGEVVEVDSPAEDARRRPHREDRRAHHRGDDHHVATSTSAASSRCSKRSAACRRSSSTSPTKRVMLVYSCR